MKISIQEYDPQWALCKQVQCEVDETTFTGIRKEVLASFQREAQVDGFRLGKAPLAMVVQKYRPQIQKALKEGFRYKSGAVASFLQIEWPGGIFR